MFNVLSEYVWVDSGWEVIDGDPTSKVKFTRGILPVNWKEAMSCHRSSLWRDNCHVMWKLKLRFSKTVNVDYLEILPGLTKGRRWWHGQPWWSGEGRRREGERKSWHCWPWSSSCCGRVRSRGRGLAGTWWKEIHNTLTTCVHTKFSQSDWR